MVLPLYPARSQKIMTYGMSAPRFFFSEAPCARVFTKPHRNLALRKNEKNATSLWTLAYDLHGHNKYDDIEKVQKRNYIPATHDGWAKRLRWGEPPPCQSWIVRPKRAAVTPIYRRTRLGLAYLAAIVLLEDHPGEGEDNHDNSGDEKVQTD